MIVVLKHYYANTLKDRGISFQDDFELTTFAIQFQKVAVINSSAMQKCFESDHVDHFLLTGGAICPEGIRDRIFG
jgi:hypothetical protein